MRPAVFVLSLLVLASAGEPLAARQAPRSPRNASYVLDARLDAVNRLILGTGRLTWRNIARIPATELQLHLYWNAWRDDASTYMREARLIGSGWLAERTRTDPALIDITRLRLGSGDTGTDLLAGARYIAPDDGNAADRTVLLVPLPRPVEPGDSIALEFSWNARVPRVYDRTGAIGDFFFIAQWFPKIGVLEDDGWSTHQFHANTEFFADFGTYDVSLTVPSGWTVAATGRQASRVDHNDGSTTHRYSAEDVHDFAWSTSPSFVEVRETVDRPGSSPLDVRLLLQPEHALQADRHLAAARAALDRLGRWVGPYPYPQLTIVDPVTIVDTRLQGGSVGGMEYPTLITSLTGWHVPWGHIDPEDVIAHEIAHQYFQGIVATNEAEHAWMDEGITTYLTGRLLADAFPNRFLRVERYFGDLLPWSYQDVPWSRVVDSDRLGLVRRARSQDVPAQPSWTYSPGSAGAISYARTSVWLHTLERLVGWDTMRRVLATYVERFAWRHPAPEDFFSVASEVAGRDLTWFFDAVHRQAASFDYAVGAVSTRATDTGSFDHTIVIRRLGSGVFPIDVRVAFEDGATVTERWDGAASSRTLTYRRGSRLMRVDVDPDRVLLLDARRINNSWTARAQAPAAASRWAIHWIVWLQQKMLTYAFFV